MDQEQVIILIVQTRNRIWGETNFIIDSSRYLPACLVRQSNQYFFGFFVEVLISDTVFVFMWAKLSVHSFSLAWRYARTLDEGCREVYTLLFTHSFGYRSSPVVWHISQAGQRTICLNTAHSFLCLICPTLCSRLPCHYFIHFICQTKWPYNYLCNIFYLYNTRQQR